MTDDIEREVKPDLETLARAIYAQEAQPICDEVSEQMVGYRPWGWLAEEHRDHYRSRAGELIDLFPGRTEREVKAEAWDEAVRAVIWADMNGHMSLTYAVTHNPYREVTVKHNPYRREAD